MNAARSVTIGARTYLIGSLNCFEQFHVTRRMESENIATMKNEDADFVLHTCLSVVRVQEAENVSAPLMDKNSKQLRYQDLDMRTMLQLVREVIKDNLESFFPTEQPK